MKKTTQNDRQIDAQTRKNRFWLAKGARRTHWDYFLGGGGDAGEFSDQLVQRTRKPIDITGGGDPRGTAAALSQPVDPGGVGGFPV